MKTLRFFLAVVATAAALVACKKENPGTTDKPSDKPDDKPGTYDETLSLSPYEVTFEAEGGTVKVAVETSAEDYTVTGGADWLTVEKKGKEIALTAAPNTETSERKCELTVKGKVLTSALPVTQKPGSPYLGYTVAKSAAMEYGGTLLYMFMKPTEEDYGGWATVSMTDEENNQIVFWLYTDLFASAEEVEFTTGTYVKGNDDYQHLSLAAKKLTYMPGITIENDEEPYTTGTFFADAATQAQVPLVDGTLTVSKDGSTFTLLADMVDAQGKAYKYVYIGEVPIDTESAGYPSSGERIDVVNTVFGAQCYYKGENMDTGASAFALQLYSGTPENYATTNFDFYAPVMAFSEDMDISGTYMTPDEEEGLEPQAPGALDFGVLYDLGIFKYASGCYIMFDQTYSDFCVADAFASLVLSKEEDGTYTVNMASIMSQQQEMFLFMGISGLNVVMIDATQYGAED